MRVPDEKEASGQGRDLGRGGTKDKGDSGFIRRCQVGWRQSESVPIEAERCPHNGAKRGNSRGAMSVLMQGVIVFLRGASQAGKPIINCPSRMGGRT